MTKIRFEYITDCDYPNDACTVEVPITDEPHCAEAVQACITFLRALGYATETIETYIDSDAVFDELYDNFHK